MSTKLTCWRVPPKCQKFLNHHLSNFLALHLSKLDFESEKLQNCRFRGAIFFVMEVRLVRNFFLSDFGLIRGKKFFSNPKLCGTSPALYELIFTIENRKLSIFLIFQGKFIIFSTFVQNPRSPQVSEISFGNKLTKIDIWWGRTKISATFDPPNPRSQNPSWKLIFNL